MGNANDDRLRGKELDGSDQKESVDHADFVKQRNPDAELRLDGEEDTLYNDGLDVEEDKETLADTHGNVKRG